MDDKGRRLRRIGILGGMSWQSTAVYYRLLNEGVARAHGGLHSAELLIDSADLAPLATMQHDGAWDAIARELSQRGQALQLAGAEALVIATNTMHIVAEQIEDHLTIPLIHVVDEVAGVAMQNGWRTLGLLGTDFTMGSSLYPERLGGLGLQVRVPGREDRDAVHRIIYEELCNGMLEDESRDAYLRVVEWLAGAGCDAVVLGCTEIGLLLTPDCGSALPLIDSTKVHAEAALTFALGQ